MKPQDPLLGAWEETLVRKDDSPAIFSTRDDVVRSFREIEQQMRVFERKIDKFPPGSVVAVQIGNDEAWPAIFLACLRCRVVVLPLDESVGQQQRDAAFKTCGVVAAAVSGGRDLRLLPADTVRAGLAQAATPQRYDNPPAVLKLISLTSAATLQIRFLIDQLQPLFLQ